MSASVEGQTFTQLVEPNTLTKDATGMCLRFAQSVFGAPVAHRSATDAANATKFRHHTREMPDVAALVWFDHYGTYQNEFSNWGHVVAWVPGGGFLSSPGTGYGQQWFPSIDAVERTFNAKFRFWSEDINTLRVAEPATPAPVIVPEEEDIMAIYLEATGNSSPIDAKNPGTSRVWAGSNREIGGVTYSGVWERSEDGSVRRLFPGEWQAIQDAYVAAGRKVPVAKISGNELEKMFLIKRAAPSK